MRGKRKVEEGEEREGGRVRGKRKVEEGRGGKEGG